jgi:hypothetical protein
MATKVAGEQYYDIDGQLNEIKRQLRQPAGYPFDPNQLQQALQLVIEGKFSVPSRRSQSSSGERVASLGLPHSGIVRDLFFQKDWIVFRDDEHLPDDWDPTTTVLVNTEGERIDPTLLEGCQSLKGKRQLGARAFWWYWNDTTKIPREWRTKYVCFDATVFYQPEYEQYYVLYLDHESGSWGWDTYRTDEPRVKGTFSACLP